MGRSISQVAPVDSTLLNVLAGEDLSSKDLVALTSTGYAKRVLRSDYASIATAQIVATTSLGGSKVAGTPTRPSVLQGGDGALYFACQGISSSQDAGIVKYSATGSFLGAVAVHTGTSGSISGLKAFFLSNGDICLFYRDDSASTCRFAIVDANLNIVKTETAVENLLAASMDAAPLSNGRFVIVGQSAGTASLLRMAIYSNTGSVVSAVATIFTASNTAGTYSVKVGQMSDGNIVVAASLGGFSTSNGTYAGTYTAAGAAISAFSRVDATALTIAQGATELAVGTGYFCIANASNAGTLRALVLSNAKVVQGAAYSYTTSYLTARTYKLIVKDANSFALIFFDSNGATGDYIRIATLPTTGNGYSTLQTKTAPASWPRPLDAAVSGNELIVIVAGPNGAPSQFAVYNSQTFATVSAFQNYGANTGSLNNAIAVLVVGDQSFVAYDNLTTDGVCRFYIGHYLLGSILGVVTQNTVNGALAPIKQGAGAYAINTVQGTSPKAFDHSAATVPGNKGILLTNGVVLKGF